MKRFYIFLFTTISSLFLTNSSFAQISLGSLDDFEDGTTMNWEVGGGIDPVNIPTGGPAGFGDHFLQCTADGSSQNGKLVTFNIGSTWTGDWTAAGVTFISFMARNPSAVNLTLRVNLDGAGGRFSVTNGFFLAAGAGWTQVNFAVSPTAFTSVGGFSIVNTLAAVSIFRIIHNPSPAWQGVNVVGNLDLDLISAQTFALPISLEYFTAKSDKVKNIISWKTITESNSNYFEVERSVNGTNWELLEKVKAAGSSSSPLYYTTPDMYPYKGVSYYRLKLVDLDDHYKYSAVRSVLFNGDVKNDLTVYPNPASSFITLSGKSVIALSSINITTAMGQQVNNRVKITSLSAYKARIDVSQLPGGLYYINATNGTSLFFVNRE